MKYKKNHNKFNNNDILIDYYSIYLSFSFIIYYNIKNIIYIIINSIFNIYLYLLLFYNF